jgi:hypothetical protein
MPDAPTSPPPPTDEEIAAILATAPFKYDAYQVSPGDGDHPLLVSIARGWPSPTFMSWGLAPGRWMARSTMIPVQAADPGYEPGAYSDAEGWSRPIAEVISTIPLKVREALRPLPTTYQWCGLRVLARLTEFLDLLIENPVLAGLLANQIAPPGARTMVVAPRHIRRALRGPWRELLAMVGLPQQRWVSTALQKSDPFTLLYPGGQAIHNVLWSTDKKVRSWMQHLRWLRADVVGVLASPVTLPMSTYSLLADPGTDDEFWTHGDLHGVLAAIAKARQEGRAPRKPARFRSRAQVLDTYWKIRPTDLAAEYPGPFSTPTSEISLAGEPTIRLRPLQDAAEMLAHGVATQNCIPQEPCYFREASSGCGAMYAVTSADPGGADDLQTATLWIQHDDEGGSWEVEQLSLARDTEVPGWLHDRVQVWVELLREPSEIVRQLDDRQLDLPFR